MIVLFTGSGGGLVVPTGELMPFGAQDLQGNATGSPEWLYPGIMPTTELADEFILNGVAVPLPRAGTLRRIAARHNTLGAPGPVIRYEVYRNAIATGLFVDLAPNVSQVVGPALGLALAAGDALAVLASYPGGDTTAPEDVAVTLDIA